MKRNQKSFFSFTIIAIIVFVITAGCAGVQPSGSPALPADITGTWERANSRNTLTITSTTIKASNQEYTWIISSVSGDIYTIYPEPNPALKGTVSLKLIGEYLEVIDAYDMSNANVWSGSEDDWTGKWKIK